MEINRLECFPAEDGHIESVLIGVEKVKVSFQTWDARMLVLIFNDVGAVTSLHSVYEDIGEFEVVSLEEGLKKYTFRSAWSDDSEQTKEVMLPRIWSQGKTKCVICQINEEQLVVIFYDTTMDVKDNYLFAKQLEIKVRELFLQ